jgi:hypothetical protein
MTNYGTFPVVFVYHNLEQITWKNSFMYNGAHLWNSIPNEIGESKFLSCFQNEIATHIP